MISSSRHPDIDDEHDQNAPLQLRSEHRLRCCQLPPREHDSHFWHLVFEGVGMSAHMIELAAKALCKRNVAPAPEQEEAVWSLYGGSLKGDAKAMLKACGALGLLEALRLADCALSGSNMNMDVVERKVKAAIAKATGGTK